MSELNVLILKAVGGGTVAGMAWIANTALEIAPGASKVMTNGTDITFYGALIFAVVHLWRANQKLHDRVETNLQKTNEQQAKTMSDQKDSFDKLVEAVEKLTDR